MAVHTPQNLSRAVSFVDLSAALLRTQNSPTKMHYSRDELLAYRSENSPPANNDVAKASAEDAGCPKPPPSTPHDPTSTTTPANEIDQTAADLAEIALNESGVQIVEPGSEAPKKKKKKSSGVNRKAKPTGFEGTLFLYLATSYLLRQTSMPILHLHHLSIRKRVQFTTNLFHFTCAWRLACRSTEHDEILTLLATTF